MEGINILSKLVAFSPIEKEWREHTKIIFEFYIKIRKLFFESLINLEDKGLDYSKLQNMLFDPALIKDIEKQIDSFLEIKFKIKSFEQQNDFELSKLMLDVSSQFCRLCQQHLEISKYYSQKIGPKQINFLIIHFIIIENLWHKYIHKNQAYNQLNAIQLSQMDDALQVNFQFDQQSKLTDLTLITAISNCLQNSQELFHKLFGNNSNNISIKSMIVNEAMSVNLLMSCPHKWVKAWQHLIYGYCMFVDNSSIFYKLCGELLLLHDHKAVITKRELQKFYKQFQTKPFFVFKGAKINIETISLYNYDQAQGNISQQEGAKLADNKLNLAPSANEPNVDKITASNNLKAENKPDQDPQDKNNHQNDDKRIPRKDHIGFLTGG